MRDDEVEVLQTRIAPEERAGEVQPLVALTQSATANIAIRVLGWLPATPDNQQEIEIWSAVGNMSTDTLRDEEIRLADPDQTPNSTFGSATRDQVLRTIEIERLARSPKFQNISHSKWYLHSSVREIALIVLGGCFTLLSMWLLGK